MLRPPACTLVNKLSPSQVAVLSKKITLGSKSPTIPPIITVTDHKTLPTVRITPCDYETTSTNNLRLSTSQVLTFTSSSWPGLVAFLRNNAPCAILADASVHLADLRLLVRIVETMDRGTSSVQMTMRLTSGTLPTWGDERESMAEFSMFLPATLQDVERLCQSLRVGERWNSESTITGMLL